MRTHLTLYLKFKIQVALCGFRVLDGGQMLFSSFLFLQPEIYQSLVLELMKHETVEMYFPFYLIDA